MASRPFKSLFRGAGRNALAINCRGSLLRSEHPEIRAEVDRLREWSSDEIDELRQEREARQK